MRSLLVWAIVGLGFLTASGASLAAALTVEVGHDDDQAHASYLAYFPQSITVTQGDTVTWVSHSDDPHTVTEGLPSTFNDRTYRPAFDSSPTFGTDPADAAMFGPGGFLLPGEQYSHTFNNTGDYQYRCKIHPGMEGWVHVRNATGPGGLPLGPGGAQPETVYVDAGDGSGAVSVDRFGPADITVAPGTTVVWTNRHSDEPHTITSNTTAEKYDSSPAAPDLTGGAPPPNDFLGPGGVLFEFTHTTFNMTFDQPGTWSYHCKLHQGMWGSVTVLPKQSAAVSEVTPTPVAPAPAPTPNAPARTPGLDAPFVMLGLAAVALLVRRP